jgi:hypothetical protein
MELPLEYSTSSERESLVFEKCDPQSTKASRQQVLKPEEVAYERMSRLFNIAGSSLKDDEFKRKG